MAASELGSYVTQGEARNISQLYTSTPLGRWINWVNCNKRQECRLRPGISRQMGHSDIYAFYVLVSCHARRGGFTVDRPNGLGFQFVALTW